MRWQTDIISSGMCWQRDYIHCLSSPLLSTALTQHTAMSSRIQAGLQRLDAALKSCPNRAALKSGTAESWVAGNTGLAAVTSIYRSSVFSDPNSGAAPWIQWRKSNVSKQLLGFIRAVMEVVEADQRTACPTPALLLTAHTAMRATVHGCIRLLAELFAATQSAALWPAMREWLVDQSGIKSLWAALAQSMALAGRDSAALLAAVCGTADSPLSEVRQTLCYSTLGRTIVSALSLTNQLQIAMSSAGGPQSELSLLFGLVVSLSILFSEILPKEVAAGHAHEWDVINVLRLILKIRIRSRSVGRI